jgi:hypothetical protein
MPRRPSISPRLLILVAAFMALASWPGSALSQTSSSASSACYAHLSRAKLVSSGKGWAVVDQPSNRPVDHSGRADDCTDEHLYWTDNDGQTWREITPPNMPTRSMGTSSFTPATGLQTIFFLDSSHGRMISTDTLNEDNDARLYFLSTEDGGKNWRSLLIQPPAYKLMDDMWPTQVYFSDPRHGWILWHWAMMNSSADALLSTTDGGRTWKRLPDPPGAGPLDFTSGRDGWMIGGPIEWEGIGRPGNTQLWLTHDGGEQWKPISIPVSADSPERVSYAQLKFDKRGDGVVAVQTWLSDYVVRFITCVTHDEGRSWQVSHFDAYEASPSLVDMHVIWTVFHLPKTEGTIFDRTRPPNTIRIGDREITPRVPVALSLEGGLGNVDFSDDSHGWTTYLNGRPSRFGLPGLAFDASELLSTTDGGESFRIITPPAAEDHPVPPPELYILNGSLVRYPPPPPFALRRPPILPNGRGQIRFAPSVGGPTIITGTGFQRENTVWIGSHQIEVASSDGRDLRFLIPPDVAPGTYNIYVENSYGKTNETEISIRSPQTLANLNINDGETIHPGQQIIISGPGFLLENQVWFDVQAVPAELIISGGPMLRATVPSSVPRGRCDVYVSNATGKSNVFTVTIE